MGFEAVEIVEICFAVMMAAAAAVFVIFYCSICLYTRACVDDLATINSCVLDQRSQITKYELKSFIKLQLKYYR